jgi:hypothetical protein
MQAHRLNAEIMHFLNKVKKHLSTMLTLWAWRTTDAIIAKKAHHFTIRVIPFGNFGRILVRLNC